MAQFEKTLEQEFSDNLYEFLSEALSQAKIKTAIDNKDIGMLSRLFNDMSHFSTTARKNALSEMKQAQTDNQLRQHMTQVMKNMTQLLVTPSYTDLTEDAKQKVGMDNYKQLLLLCNNDTKKLTNYYLQAIGVLYTMVLTQENNNELGVDEIKNALGATMIVDKATQKQMTEKQHLAIKQFQNNICLPLFDYTIHLSTDSLSSPFDIDQYASDELKSEFTQWYGVIEEALVDFRSFTQHFSLTDDEENQINAIIKKFEVHRDTLETFCVKFSEGMPVMEKDCDEQLNNSVTELAIAVKDITDLTSKYHITKSWIDKFWDLVSKITQKDWQTTSSKKAEASIKLAGLPMFTSEKIKSRSSSQASMTSNSTLDSIENSEDDSEKKGYTI